MFLYDDSTLAVRKSYHLIQSLFVTVPRICSGTLPDIVLCTNGLIFHLLIWHYLLSAELCSAFLVHVYGTSCRLKQVVSVSSVSAVTDEKNCTVQVLSQAGDSYPNTRDKRA
jgi:hypothetical protein